MSAWTRWRRPAEPSWRSLLWRRPPTPVLVAEADRLIARGRRRAAARVLAVAAESADAEARRPILERLAVTAADAGNHGLSRDAVYELSRLGPHTAPTWVAFANVALARGNHLHADRASRAALAQAPGDRGAWVAMAAGFAGLGWFEQTEDCLDRLDRDGLDGGDRRRIGRAINRWALAGTRWALLAVVALPLLGVVATIAAAGPVAIRRWRLRQLRRSPDGGELADMAAEAWRSSFALRLADGLGIGAPVAALALAGVLT